MTKEYYLELLRTAGFEEKQLKDYGKLNEESLQALAEKFEPKKRGRKSDTLGADAIIAKLKEKSLTARSKVNFELFSGKGRQNSEGMVTGSFQGYKLYAVVDYHNEKTNKIEKKEIDAFKI